MGKRSNIPDCPMARDQVGGGLPSTTLASETQEHGDKEGFCGP